MGDRTADRARGRWLEILPAFGIDRRFLNGKHHPCPVCGGKDRFRFDNKNHFGEYFCSQCGAGHGIKLLMIFNGWDYAETAKQVDKLIGNAPALKFVKTTINVPNKKSLRNLWTKSAAISANDPAGRYLASRSIERVPKCLRYVQKMRHQNGGIYHGMIAVFSGPDGTPSTLHRTYLTEEGRKADVDPVRMFMPGQIAKGGAVRLMECDKKLGVAEGIETALSAAQIHDIPVWATLNEGLLRVWEPPAEVKFIVVFGDNDENFVGQSAAFDLAKRLARTKEIFVEVRIPKLVGHDWNDSLCEAMG